jgi:hypothetical protein
MTQTTIRVHPSSGALDARIQGALAALTPVTFVSCSNLADCREGDAVIILSGDSGAAQGLAARKVPCFHVASGTANGDDPPMGGESIQFTRSRLLDQRLRSRLLMHKPIPGYSGLRIERGDEVLAYCADKPVWVIRNRGDSPMHVVSIPLPSLAAGDTPFNHLRRERFFRLLPLLHFLREVTADSGWKNPPLRACLMLDDPNLHWTSYGFLPYEQLLDQAKSHRFHVAFATVPLDAWLSKTTAVKLFRDHPEQFSLLVHGNDHSKHELSQSRTKETYLRLAAQSLRRIDRLEKTTGLHVARVMAPPHGACTAECLATLSATGFEGVCAAPNLLLEFNPQVFRDANFGLGLAEITPGNAPIIPRFRLDSSCEGAIVISAFLDRPIIPVGHHHTAANGLDLLINTVEIINSLGQVSWGSPEMMLRSNFRSFQEDTTLWVEPYSNRIQLTIPPGVTDVRLYRPEKTVPDADSDFVFVLKRGPKLLCRQNASNVPLKVMAGDHIELVSLGLGKVNYRQVENPQFSVQALPRRLLCELRDRLMPLIPRDVIPKKWMSG